VAGGRASTYSWFTASASSDSDSEAPAAAAAFAPESASTTKQQTPGSRGERKRSERAEIEEEGRRRRAGREGRAGGRSPLPLATAPFSSSLDFFSGDSDAGGGEAGGGEPSPTAAEGEGGGRFWAGIGTAAGWGRVERRRGRADGQARVRGGSCCAGAWGRGWLARGSHWGGGLPAFSSALALCDCEFGSPPGLGSRTRRVESCPGVTGGRGAQSPKQPLLFRVPCRPSSTGGRRAAAGKLVNDLHLLHAVDLGQQDEASSLHQTASYLLTHISQFSRHDVVKTLEREHLTKLRVI
jgi:hypothetical protein